MGVLRIERRTSVLSGQRSNHLSYTPENDLIILSQSRCGTVADFVSTLFNNQFTSVG